MTARILDGAGTLKILKDEMALRVAALRGRGVIPTIGSVMVGDDPDDRWAVRIRHKDSNSIGIDSIRRELPAGATQANVEAVLDELNADPACIAYGVQPPRGLDEFALLSRIDPAKDVDGLHPDNLGKLVLGESGPVPGAALGVLELLHRHAIHLDGVDVCVVGRGRSVGRPLALLLTQRSENATVTVCHTGTRDLAAHVRRADVVIAAAGVPGLITADMVKPGATVVDVGLSTVDGTLTGDVSAGVEEVAGWMSKNPGGVGPMTRAMLLMNVVTIAERQSQPTHPGGSE